MNKNPIEHIRNITQKPSTMPYDGIITAVYPESVTVRPVGQTRARSIRNVLIPSSIDYTTLSPGQPCRIDTSRSTPALIAVYSGIETVGYSSVGTVIPDPPVLSVIGGRRTDGSAYYDISFVVNNSKYISGIKIYYNESNSTSGMTFYGEINNPSITVRVDLDENETPLWFGAKSISGLNESALSSPLVTAPLPENHNESVQDRFDTYGSSIFDTNGIMLDWIYLPIYESNAGITWSDAGIYNEGDPTFYGTPVYSASMRYTPDITLAVKQNGPAIICPVGDKTGYISCDAIGDYNYDNGRIFIDFTPDKPLDLTSFFNFNIDPTTTSGIIARMFVLCDSQGYHPTHSIGIAVEHPSSPGDWVYLIGDESTFLNFISTSNDNVFKVHEDISHPLTLLPRVMNLTNDSIDYTNNNPDDFKSVNKIRLVVTIKGNNSGANYMNLAISYIKIGKMFTKLDFGDDGAPADNPWAISYESDLLCGTNFVSISPTTKIGDPIPFQRYPPGMIVPL